MSANSPSNESLFRASYGTLAWACRPIPSTKETIRHCVQSILRDPFRAIDPSVEQRTDNLISQLNEYFFKKPVSQASIEDAVSICRELLSRRGLGKGLHQIVQANLAAYLDRKYQITGASTDLEEAARLGHEAAMSIPEDDENKLLALFNFLEILGKRYKVTNTTGALEQLLDIGRQVYERLPLDDPDRPELGDNLRKDLTEMFQRTNEEEFLTEAVAVAKTLIGQGDARPRDRIDMVRQLLTKKYERTSELVDLEDAILHARRVLDEVQDDFSDQSYALHNLAILMSDRYTHRNEMSDLEQAICLCRQATTHNIPEQIEFSYNLSVMIRKLYERTRDPKSLAEALELSKITILSPDHLQHPQRSRWLSNHAQCLIHSYWVNPSLELIDEAIDHNHAAVEMSSLDYVDRVNTLGHLSNALMKRFEISGAIQDLRDAEKYSRDAMLVMAKERYPDAQMLNTFSAMLWRKYYRDKDVCDLDKAIEYARKAVDAEPATHANQLRNMGNLASWLADRYEVNRDPADINEALEISHGNLKMVPIDHSDRLMMLSNHILYLLQRQDPNDIDNAIRIGHRTFKEVAQNAPLLTQMREHLARALQKRLTSGANNDGQDQDDLHEAIQHFSTLAQDESVRALSRIEYAAAAAMLLSNTSDWLTAYNLVNSAIELLPTIGIRGLSWDDRQYLMRELSSVSSLAASIALEAQQSPSTALELQEAGRGVITTAVIQSRSDLSDLKLTSPELYKEYLEQRAATSFQLSRNERDPNDGLTTRSRNIRRLEDLEKVIRKRTKLTSFGLPLAPVDLMRLAGLGHIVSFNISNFRSDAFLVTQTTIEVLRLPNLRYDELQDFVKQLPQLTRGSESEGSDNIPTRNAILRKKLEWLWIVAVRPVLHAFNLTHDSREGDHLPRLWWVMSGLLGQTPLHAAGDGWGKSANNTAACVVSSYIPTFKMLANAQEKSLLAQNRKGFGIQIIAMPTTPGFNGLTFSDLSTDKEIEAIRTSIGHQVAHVEVLQSPTKDEVIKVLPNNPVIHFACHGISDPLNPSNSSMPLENSDLLTVRELADVSIPQARIAYLSACSTAQHGADDLWEEVLHLASAFQLVGFPHVLGTLWEADDVAAVRMAGLFYKELALQMNMEEGGRGNYTDGQVALAHHRAVEKLRKGVVRSNANNVIKWATFVHLGC